VPVLAGLATLAGILMNDVSNVPLASAGLLLRNLVIEIALAGIYFFRKEKTGTPGPRWRHDSPDRQRGHRHRFLCRRSLAYLLAVMERDQRI